MQFYIGIVNIVGGYNFWALGNCNEGTGIDFEGNYVRKS